MAQIGLALLLCADPSEKETLRGLNETQLLAFCFVRFLELNRGKRRAILEVMRDAIRAEDCAARD